MSKSPSNLRTVTILKRGEVFVFRCPPGEELALMGLLIARVRNSPGNPLDCFDLGIVAHELGIRPTNTLAAIADGGIQPFEPLKIDLGVPKFRGIIYPGAP